MNYKALHESVGIKLRQISSYKTDLKAKKPGGNSLCSPVQTSSPTKKWALPKVWQMLLFGCLRILTIEKNLSKKSMIIFLC